MKVFCPKCSEKGSLAVYRDRYYRVAHYGKETKGIKWCFIGTVEDTDFSLFTTNLTTTTLLQQPSNYSSNKKVTSSGGFQAWSKEQGLGPCGVGLRGFKSHPPHHYGKTAGGFIRALGLA